MTRGEEIVIAYGGAINVRAAGGPFPLATERGDAYYIRVEAWAEGARVDVAEVKLQTTRAMSQKLIDIGWTPEALAQHYPEYVPTGDALSPTIDETVEEYVARVATADVSPITLVYAKEEEVIGKEKALVDKEPTADKESVAEELVSKFDSKWLLYGAVAIVAIIFIVWVARRK